MNRLISAFVLGWLLVVAAWGGQTLTVRLDPVPEGGGLVAMLFDSPEGFEDLQSPVHVLQLPADGRDELVFEGVVPGRYALVVFHDENENQRLDVNFIGIPKEPVGFPNAYRPKGPPGFERASVALAGTEASAVQIGLIRPLGRFGQLGIGAGVLARGSPYARSTGNPVRFLPVLTYIGSRVQILGPSLQVGLAGSGDIRLAGTLAYRMGVYAEEDSPVLAGMGNRRDTAMGGLNLQVMAPQGFGVAATYTHDVLDRIGGGQASLQLSRSLPWRKARFTPSLALNWTDRRLVRHDVGVPAAKATPQRPAYTPGSTIGLEGGLSVFLEITDSVIMVSRFGMEWLDDEVRASPIIDDDYVLSGFLFVTWML